MNIPDLEQAYPYDAKVASPAGTKVIMAGMYKQLCGSIDGISDAEITFASYCYALGFEYARYLSKYKVL
jgi:hypothetical protein